MMRDVRDTRRQAAEHGECPVRRPLDAALSRLLSESNRLRPVLARQLGRAGPDVKQQQRAVNPSEQGRVAQPFGNVEGKVNDVLRLVTTSYSLEAHALRDQGSRLHR